MKSVMRRPAPSRRTVLAGLGAIGALAALTACGGSGGSDPTTTLYTWISNENDRAQWQAFIDAAKESDPEFALTLEGPSFENYWTKVKTRMSSGDAPALLTTQAARAQELDALLAPLEDLAEGAGVDLSQYNEAMIAGMTVDGSLRAIPYDAEPMVLFYNRALFEDAGVELPGTTYSMDQFLDNATSLTSGEKYGLAISAGLVHLGMSVGFANGGSPVTDGALTLTDPKIVEAMQFGFDLVVEHEVASAPAAVDSEPASQQDLMNGKVAMYVDGPWMYQAYEDALGDDLGVAIIPSETGEAKGLIQGSGFGIASNAQDQQSAFASIATITTPEVIGAVANSRGTFPSLASQEERWAEGKLEDNVAAVTRLAHDGEPLITTPTWNEVDSKFTQYATDGFQGNRTAQEILTEIQEAVG
ncbi:ABC transporter substrate-binding protein [Brachybacterium sacelli]|uniref:Multiple sugar transport system substrate-binding protein n=1 Tax=Brachybacterium sacelli TaxID=173364 RepID=A0ABS4WYY8_9MICO|nr:sugar ABC transporter substrate-binding protein [Brachybacterium sacelli]MBP2381425.1 multiple sugar transport system substrate-binding protein [Brachybacterium sacelli]